MIPEHKEKALTAAKKAQSHLAKVVSMMEGDAYCIDIMQQVLAVQGLLKSVTAKMMYGHLHTCFKTVMEGKNEVKKDEIIDEVMQVIKMSTK